MYPDGGFPTMIDVGCGFGGLTVALSTLFPDERALGMEIRAKVRHRPGSLDRDLFDASAQIQRTCTPVFRLCLPTHVLIRRAQASSSQFFI
jgi:hypothetical protein